MDLKKTVKRKNFIINIAYLALVLLLAFLCMEYVLRWVMPFLLGFIIALAFRPLIRLITDKTKINRRFCAFCVIILGYGLVGFLVWLLGNALFQNIKEFCLNLPNFYNEEISPFLESANQGVLGLANRLSPDMAAQVRDTLSELTDTLQTYLIDISTTILSSLASGSKRLPLFLISFIFTILSSLFIGMDYDNVMAFIKRQIPDKNKAMLSDIRSYLGRTIISYGKAYMILMCITFLELSVGFLALRVKNPFGLAALIAIADAFPILGTGTVVLPWAVISLFQQRYYLALGLLLLYLIITAVRQFIEPKVVGDQLGLPPIVSIICIYLGFVWFGIKGAILFPITMNIILCLHRAGKIHIWK